MLVGSLALPGLLSSINSWSVIMEFFITFSLASDDGFDPGSASVRAAWAEAVQGLAIRVPR
jgi:hypothetical protein